METIPLEAIGFFAVFFVFLLFCGYLNFRQGPSKLESVRRQVRELEDAFKTDVDGVLSRAVETQRAA